MFVRHITEIKAAVSPFNPASKSLRLFLNRVNTEETRKLSPTLKISAQFLQQAQAPSHLDIVYRDGQKLSLDTDRLKIDNVVELVNKHAKKLEEIEQANSW